LPYSLLRPLLFRLDAERAHDITLALLDAAARVGLPPVRPAAASPLRIMGLEFSNPIGLAAGLDKNGAHIDALARLGFGFIEVGTVTPRPQAGNPRPRMFRIPQARAVINRMGFNNLGVDRLVRNVRESSYRGVLGINIGKNADTPIERAAGDYLACMRKTYPLASYLAVNISSPNTRNLRQLQQAEELGRLLAQLKAEQQRLADQHGRYVPLALKIAPDLDEDEVQAVADELLAHRVDAVIATNTTVSRAGVEGLPHCQEAGGLSGAPLTVRATHIVRLLARHLDRRIPIIGVGGIMSAADAAARLEAGASLLQLYSGLVYAGPGLIYDCVNRARQAAAPLARAPALRA
jgi:dihydroorotate dehydrogenase